MDLQLGRQVTKLDLACGVGGWHQDPEMSRHGFALLLHHAAGAGHGWLGAIAAGSPPLGNADPARSPSGAGAGGAGGDHVSRAMAPCRATAYRERGARASPTRLG